MMKVCVFTETGSSVLTADSMTIHGETLFVYSGDELVGMFRMEFVKAAYRTESRG